MIGNDWFTFTEILFLMILFSKYFYISIISEMIGTNYVKGLNIVDPMPIEYSQDSINLSDKHFELQ